MVSTLSLTPASSTVWLPSGIPASASRLHAWLTSKVSSSGWAKWMLIQSGWWRFRVWHSVDVIRWGSTTGTFVPIRISSTWGIARNLESSHSRASSGSVSGSPPESRTSRTAGVLSM